MRKTEHITRKNGNFTRTRQMNHHCPYCEEDLAWRFLAKRAAFIMFIPLFNGNAPHIANCPKCKRSLGYKAHGSEKFLQQSIWISVLSGLILWALWKNHTPNDTGILMTVVGIIFFCGFLGAILQLVQPTAPKPWRRYERRKK